MRISELLEGRMKDLYGKIQSGEVKDHPLLHPPKPKVAAKPATKFDKWAAQARVPVEQVHQEWAAAKAMHAPNWSVVTAVTKRRLGLA